MDVVWESETTVNAGITTNYYYCYILTQGAHGGLLDDNGSILSSTELKHPDRRNFLDEGIDWLAAFGWYSGGAYNYVCVQTGHPTSPSSKQFAIPVDTGPGALAARSEYLVNLINDWYPAILQAATAYNGYTQNNNIMKEQEHTASRATVVTADTATLQPTYTGYSMRSPGRQTSWAALRTKGLLMDLTAAETQPSFAGSAANKSIGNPIIQATLSFKLLAQVRYFNTDPTPPDQLKMTYNDTGIGSVVQLENIIATYTDPDNASWTIGIAEFTFTLGVAGDQTGTISILIQSFSGGFLQFDTTDIIFYTCEPAGHYMPPFYNTPTTDGKSIEGGYIA